MEQNNKIHPTFTQRDIEQHLQSALAAATPDVWSKLDLTVVQEQPPKLLHLKRRFRRLGMAAAAGLCLIVAGGGYYQYEYLQVASQVEIDVNPSLKLSLNRRDRVLYAEALNTDAEELVDSSSLKGQTVDQAVDQVVDSLVEKGYLQKGEEKHAVLVSVSGQNEAKVQQLKASVTANVEHTLTENEVQAVVYDQVIQVTKELEELAETYQVSVGKAEFVGQLINENEDLNQDQQDAYSRMMGQSMEELTREIDANAYQVSSNVTIIRTEPVKSRERSVDRREKQQLAEAKAALESKSQEERSEAAAKEQDGQSGIAAAKGQDGQSGIAAAKEQDGQSGIAAAEGRDDRSGIAAAEEQDGQREAAGDGDNHGGESKDSNGQGESGTDPISQSGEVKGGNSEEAGAVIEDTSESAASGAEFNPSEPSVEDPEDAEEVRTETMLAGAELPSDGEPDADKEAELAAAQPTDADREIELAAAQPMDADTESAAVRPSGMDTGAASAAVKPGKADRDLTPSLSEESYADPAPADSEDLMQNDLTADLEVEEGKTEPSYVQQEAGRDSDTEETAGEAAGNEASEAAKDKMSEAAADETAGETVEAADEEAADESKESEAAEGETAEPDEASDQEEGKKANKPRWMEIPEKPKGPGELADLDDDMEDEDSSRIIYSPSNRSDTFEPGDTVSKKETGSMITSNGNQIIFEAVEKKEWKEPVYASELLTGSERCLLQKGPGVFSENASEEDQEAVMRFGPGFAAFSEGAKGISRLEGDIFLNHGFLGLRRIIREHPDMG